MTVTKTRRTRSSKTTKVLPKVEELRPAFVSRPEPNLKFSDYVSDVKVRWAIHQYEIEKLGEDLTKLRKFVSQKISQFSDVVYYSWAEM